MWCCGKVDVIEPGPPSDTLKVDVAIAAKPIVLMSRADLENQIVVVKKDVDVGDIAEAAVASYAETEFSDKAIVALLGMAFFATAAYLVFNVKADETFYIDAPHDL
jgi:hypothetical protein